jgi:transposase
MNTGEARMHQATILARQGYTQREIGAALGVTDRMVRYYLTPKSRTTRSPRTSMLDPFRQFITEVLSEAPHYNLEVLRKRLSKMGYSGSMTILRVFAKKVRDEVVRQAVVRFETEPGLQAQVDWKHAGTWSLCGEIKKVYAFVMLLGYSRRAYVRFTTDMKSATLLACHLEAFAYFGGMSSEILYDNMKTAWLNEGGRWVEHPALRAFASECGFAPKRCAVRRPQTKGKVERFIGYLGNNFLPLARERGIQSLEDLNAAVREWLDTVDDAPVRTFCQTRSERFELERTALRPFSSEHAPDVRQAIAACVSREGLVRYETNSYSVPARYIGKVLIIRHHAFERTATLVALDGFRRDVILLPAGGRQSQVLDSDRRELLALWKRQRDRDSTTACARRRSPIATPIDVEIRPSAWYERFAQAVSS